jgi:hypothetical protein
MRFNKLVLLLTILLMVGATPARKALGAAPTGAVLADNTFGLDASPVMALLEARLSEQNDIRLVERTEIARILQEQKLSLLFGPEGGPDRVQAGKILKSDLLFLLRATERPGTDGHPIRSIDLAVSETTRGIRVMMSSVPWTNDAEKDAFLLAEQISRGIRKSRQPFHDICAVPPFLSNDLTHQFDYLQAGYARLIEQALLDQPGIVVVEFAEARAIGEESALSGGGVARRPPLYLHGEYRNDGIGENLRVSVRLTLRRGATQLATMGKADLKSAEIGPFLLRAAGELLAEALGHPLQPHDTETEAAQLFARAGEFQRVANWQEALTCLDAGLLLQPRQAQALFDAAVAAGNLAATQTDTFGYPEKYLRQSALALDSCRRALQYLVAYQHMQHPAFDPYFLPALKPMREAADRNLSYTLSRKAFPAVDQARGQWTLVAREGRERLFTAIEKAGDASREEKQLLLSSLTRESGEKLRRMCAGSDELYAVKTRLLRGFLHLYGNPRNGQSPEFIANVLFRLAAEGLLPADFTSREYAAFLEQVAALEHPTVPAVLDRLRQQQNPAIDTQPPMPIADHDIRFIPLNPKLINPRDGEGPAAGKIGGWLPCGKGIDLLWGTRSLYLMKEPGEVKEVYRGTGVFFFSGVCYDGQYVWAPVVKRQRASEGTLQALEPFLVVLDPITEQCWQFTAQDGLPPAERMAAAGVSPGTICLVGQFDRSWCALLTLGDDGKKTVDIIHEARVQPSAATNGALDANLAFDPLFVVRLDAEQEPRLLVGRIFAGKLPPYPLLIDTQTRKVEVLPETMGLQKDALVVHNGALYFMDHTGIVRFGLPDFQRQVLGSPSAQDASGVFAIVGDRLHFLNIITHRWWTMSPLPGTWTALRGDAPYRPDVFPFGISPSRHYGLIYHCGTDYYAVELLKAQVK